MLLAVLVLDTVAPSLTGANAQTANEKLAPPLTGANAQTALSLSPTRRMLVSFFL